MIKPFSKYAYGKIEINMKMQSEPTALALAQLEKKNVGMLGDTRR